MIFLHSRIVWYQLKVLKFVVCTWFTTKRISGPSATNEISFCFHVYSHVIECNAFNRRGFKQVITTANMDMSLSALKETTVLLELTHFANALVGRRKRGRT